MPVKKSTIVSAAEFLEAYKYLEQMIRDAYGSNKTVVDYEQTLPIGAHKPQRKDAEVWAGSYG